MSTARSSSPTPLRAVLAVLTAFVALFALAGTAAAAPGSGKVSLELRAGTAGSLQKQGVAVTYKAKAGKTGSAKRVSLAAGGKSRTLNLRVAEVTIAGETATIGTAGRVAFAAGPSKVFLDGIEVEAGGATTVSGKLGGEQMVVFRAKGKASVSSPRVALGNGKLSLTAKAARKIAGKLGFDQLSAGHVGSIGIEAEQELEAPKTVVPTPPAPEEPKKETPTPGEPYPYETECPVQAKSGAPMGEIPGAVAGTLPLPTFNANTSQKVVGTEVDWGFSDSFRGYLLGGAKGSIQTLAGAAPMPAGGMALAAPGAYVAFSADGTYEAGNEPGNAGDALVANGHGTVLFCTVEHGFNFVVRDPTVVIDGDSSRIVADIGSNQNGTWYPFQRVDLAELDLSGVSPVITEGGNTLVWQNVSATLTEDGALAAGLGYDAGEVLDTVTVKTQLDQPLLATCDVDAKVGPAPRPTVDFTKVGLPALNDPVTRSGDGIGTINWGFRRGTRNSIVLAGGDFKLLDGATAAYADMGGGPTPASVGGGLGKFFRFPVSSYQYDDGEPANLKDDRLIAVSDATVVFCNTNPAQMFAVVLSKPTLVIDGANSRIVANAYSYQKDKGWIGGRVDLVKLDPSAIDAVQAGGKVTWGDVKSDNEELITGIAVSGAIQTEALSLANLTPASTATSWDPVASQIALPPVAP